MVLGNVGQQSFFQINNTAGTQQVLVCKAVMPSILRKTCSSGQGRYDQSALPSAELKLY